MKPTPMKAMILAAGLGTRLQPFTLEHPKALFVVDGKTLLEHAIVHLREAGVEAVLINVHHFASQIIDYVRLNNGFGCTVSFSDETGELLETGGGLKKASWFFEPGEDFIVRNVDILSDLYLKMMIRAHQSSGAIATLAIRNRKTSRYLLFNDSMKLCGWENLKTGERIITENIGNSSGEVCKSIHGDVSCALTPFAFSGIQILNSAIFPLIIEEGRFSLITLYLRLSRSNPIHGYQDTSQLWKDIGTAS